MSVQINPENIEKKEKNKKIGIGVYYSSLIIVILVMLYTIIFVKNEDNNILSIWRYMVSYFCFAGVLSIGIIVREFLVDEYILKKMIIKIIVVSVAVIGGIVAFCFIKLASIGLVMFFVSLACLLFVLVPTIPKEYVNNKK